MPGLNQLKQFNSDLLNLGDEVKIRSARGEKPSIVPIPRDVKDVDDSEDFKNGMPKLSEEEQAQAEAAAAEAARDQNDFSDITGEGEDEEAAPAENAPVVPDMSDLLSPGSDLSFDDLDLSEFEEPAKPKEPPKPKEIPIEDLDLDALLAPKPQPAEPEAIQEPEPVKPVKQSRQEPSRGAAQEPAAVVPDFSSVEDLGSADDFDFDTLDSLESVPEELPSDDSLTAADTNVSPEPDDLSSDTGSFDMDAENAAFDSAANSASAVDMNADLPEEFNEMPGVMDLGAEDQDSLEEADELESEDKTDKPEDKKAAEETEVSLDDFEMPDLGDIPDIAAEEGKSEDTAAAEKTEDESAESTEVPSADDFNTDSFDTSALDGIQDMDFGTEGIEGIPDENAGESSGEDESQKINTDSFDIPEDTFDFDAAKDENSASENGEAGKEDESVSSEDNPMDFSTDGLDGLDNIDFGNSDSGSTENTQEDNGLGDIAGMDFDTSAIDNPVTEDKPLEDGSAANEETTSSGEEDNSSASGTADMPDFDFGSLPDFGSSSDGLVSPEMNVPEADNSGTEETFDTSSIDGLDFSGGNEGTDFELGNITSHEADEDDLFSIPGFSDTQTADLNKNKAPDVQIPDFTDAMEGGEKPKNTFTDAEYKRFQKNLSEYPLNVRIAIEDLVVKNEFTDDAVFAILEKVLRKAPARQIATELEKMLDVTLEVPRDFERRTASEYETYKKSLEYQLKNRIIPGAIITTAAAILVSCLLLISWTLIYKPSMASKLYRQGYTLLQEDQYPQSLEMFNKALVYKTEKNWFYKYAEAFREHKQFDKATSMYKAILAKFDHEKQAGMEWADMELNDLYDYKETERILKREVLDYHINDPDAVLMLGDVYLDWATEMDPSKFQLAKEQYDLCGQVGNSSDSNKYLSRQMRYYIRTDNLRQVLAYKEYFYPIKKGGLGAEDLTELSGYLLDKLYGRLRPAEEGLRFSIEDVRDLLERAVKADPENPVALYNMGRYFIETGNKSASNILKNSITHFEKQTRRNRSETYKYINAHRLLGEQYRDNKDYILAEKSYDDGIELYENIHDESGFESDENIGKLYADLGDIDYFISGDMDRALDNYESSVNNKNDTAAIRYKIGYIQYTKQDYAKAMGSFIRSADTAGQDTHLLLALANTLSLRNDNQAAEGYYNNLLQELNGQRELHDVILPQVRAEHSDLVETYMRASNNLGVTLARQAELTGNSSLNAKALVNFQNSLRAWDALTRNQDTMVRLDGSNLAEQNVKYLTNPTSGYKPEIYADIYKLMNGEEGLEE